MTGVTLHLKLLCSLSFILCVDSHVSVLACVFCSCSGSIKSMYFNFMTILQQAPLVNTDTRTRWSVKSKDNAKSTGQCSGMLRVGRLLYLLANNKNLNYSSIQTDRGGLIMKIMSW